MLKRLNSLTDLRQEIEILERVIEKRLNKSYINGVSVGGASKTNKISNPTLKHSLEELELPVLIEKLERHKQKCLAEIDEVSEFVLNIQDSYIRKILSLRYIYGVRSWAKIAFEIGGGNTPDGVRMAHDRYIKSHKKHNK